MAARRVRVLWLLHGVNLDMLGRRDPVVYGGVTLSELEALVGERADSLGFSTRCFHTNHEGDLVERLHAIAREGADAVIINPGAWTHYSYAVRDALELVKAPVAEVHLSAIEDREDWRRHSVIADLVAVRISGEGPDGYLRALEELARLQQAQVDA